MGRAGTSEALALFLLEMASFGCGGDAMRLAASLSGSPLPSPLLIFCRAFAAARSLPQARATGTVLNRRRGGTLDTTNEMGKRIDQPGRRQVKGT